MSTVEKNEVKEENVSRETIDDKPVEVELPLGLDEKDKKTEQVTEVKEEKKEDEVTEYSKKVQTRINQITDRYRKEQRDKEEAVRLAKELKEQNSKLETQIQNLDKGYISEYGTRIESQLEAASDALKKALEVNDTDAIVKAQQAIAKVTIEQERHRIAKQRQEEKDVSRETIQTQPPVQTQTQAKPDPDPKAKAWAEKNEWFGEHDEMTALAFGIDKKLQQEGFDLGSDEYYSELDKRIRRRFPEEFEEEKTSSVNRVAPADNTASRSNTKGRRTVKLSPSQVAMAKRLNVPLEEYAKYVKE